MNTLIDRQLGLNVRQKYKTCKLDLENVDKVIRPKATGSTLLNCDVFLTTIEDSLYFTQVGTFAAD